MDENLLENTGRQFLTFSTHFGSLIRHKYQHENQIKANTLAFHVLLLLNELAERDLTMSELACEMQITKQQLTKIINDMEEKGLVIRIHDSKNRRQVHISISPQGHAMLSDLKKQMLASTLCSLKNFTDEELAEMNRCLDSLTRLLNKFEP